jgi:protein subunit release factor A
VCNPLVDWRKSVSFGASHIACANCGLTAMSVGIDGAIVPDTIQEPDAQITLNLADLTIEWIEPRDESYDVLIGVRVRHEPSGITVEARSRALRGENERTALQALALQLTEREGVAAEQQTFG